MLRVAVDLHSDVEIMMTRVLETGLDGAAATKVVRQMDDFRPSGFCDRPVRSVEPSSITTMSNKGSAAPKSSITRAKLASSL